MKRLLAILVCMMMLSTIVLSGCRKDNSTVSDKATSEQKSNSSKTEDTKEDKNAEEDQSTTEDDSIVTPAGTFPIVEEKVTLTVFAYPSPQHKVDDYENNEFTKWLEEKTNVHLEWVLASSAKEKKQKLSLLMSSGNYPDIIFSSGFTLAEQQVYADQGVLVPLNEYIDKYGIETKKVFEAYPKVEKDLTLLDGNIYTLPKIADAMHIRAPQKMWIYEPWLEKLNLEMPNTTEDFYQVLKAFKEQDPNGNGEADEIPMAGSITNQFFNIEVFLMNAFIYDDGDKRMRVNNGKIETVFDKPEWKEGLEYLNKLYSEGLIAPESLTQNVGQLRQMGESPDVPILGAGPAHAFSALTQYKGESGRWKEFITVPPLKGPGGHQTTKSNPVQGGISFNITNNCKYPEVAFRLGDLLYSQEVLLRMITGRPDIEWEWIEEGTGVSIDGVSPAEYRALVNNKDKENNVVWGLIANYFNPSDWRDKAPLADPDNPLETILYQETVNNYIDYLPDEDSILPPLIFTKDQAAELADLDTVIYEYLKEMTARFIIGDIDISDGWDDYLEELENMKIDRLVEIYQEAYDSKMGAK